jgi:hypothetical protein
LALTRPVIVQGTDLVHALPDGRWSPVALALSPRLRDPGFDAIA